MTKKKSEVKLAEFRKLVDEEPEPLFQFATLDPLEQMALVDNIYDSLNEFFVRSAKSKILKKLQQILAFGCDSEDALNISYTWTMNAGAIYILLKQLRGANK